ncbi:MAG TPA: DUF485 domain-containing protein, partial [Afipia sp.]
MSVSDTAPAGVPRDPQSIIADPRFRMLVRERLRLRCGLSAVLLLGFFGLVLTASFAPALFDRQLPGGIPLAIGITVAIVLLTVILTGWYVYRSNRQFDSQARAISD